MPCISGSFELQLFSCEVVNEDILNHVWAAFGLVVFFLADFTSCSLAGGSGFRFSKQSVVNVLYALVVRYARSSSRKPPALETSFSSRR